MTFHHSMFILSFFLAACGDQQPETIAEPGEHQLTAEEPKQWPATVDEAVQIVMSQLSDEDKNLIRTTHKTNLSQFHKGWGANIRNNLGLYKGNDALREAACAIDAHEYLPIKIQQAPRDKETSCHPDEASVVIMGKVWEALQK